MKGFLVWTPHPLEIPVKTQIPVKILGFETSHPLEISIDLPWGGYGYFLELHILYIHIIITYSHANSSEICNLLQATCFHTE